MNARSKIVEPLRSSAQPRYLTKQFVSSCACTCSKRRSFLHISSLYFRVTITMFLCFFDLYLNVYNCDSIKFISKIQRKFKIQRIFPLFFIHQREGERGRITMNGIISSMNPYIVLWCLRYLFRSKRLNLFKKEKKKQWEIAIGEQKSKMSFRFVRSKRFENRKKRKRKN